jgi:large subunit ribosomal protein L30
MAIKLKVTQVKSGIGRSKSQNLTLEGLGLRGPHRSVILQDTDAVRGMIRKVAHLVTVEAAD